MKGSRPQLVIPGLLPLLFMPECLVQRAGSQVRQTTCLRRAAEQPPCLRTESNSFLTLKVSRHLLNISEEQEFRQKGNESSPGTKMRFLLPVFPSDVLYGFSIAYQRQNSVLSSQLLSDGPIYASRRFMCPSYQLSVLALSAQQPPSTLYQTVM